MLLFLNKARFLFEAGRKEEGYEALEKAVSLYELLFSIPEEEMLTLDSPLFPEIAVTRSGSAYPREYGVPEWVPPGSEDSILRQTVSMKNIAVLFPAVAEEERLKSILDRIPTARPE